MTDTTPQPVSPAYIEAAKRGAKKMAAASLIRGAGRKTLLVDDIKIRDDARAVDEVVVTSIAESIADIGLLNPIRVREKQGGWEVIAGVHRLLAHRKLGRTKIECDVVTANDLDAEMAMIDENLCRKELSPSDKARQTARRKVLYLRRHPETGHGKASPSVDKEEKFSSFASDTAAKTGQTSRTVSLHAERGEKVINEAISLIRGTKLDTGAYLDKLKSLRPNEQVTAAKRDLAAAKYDPWTVEPKRAERAADENALSSREGPSLSALLRDWFAASPTRISEFGLEHCDGPEDAARSIMDDRSQSPVTGAKALMSVFEDEIDPIAQQIVTLLRRVST